MTARRTFLFAGGGSGGHLFPGLAVAEELAVRDPGARLLFIGSERGIERTILAGTSWEHAVLPMAPPVTARRHPIEFATRLGASFQAALRLIDEMQPEAVVGLGGFASIPLGIAALRRRVPLILLEQNVVPGRANSWMSRWADRVCVSFDETLPLLPRRSHVTVTGNPVRSEIARLVGGRQSRRRSLLILGGSQGAAGVNAMAVKALTRLKERFSGWQIVHQTGERDREATRTAYANSGIDAVVESFFPGMPLRYRTAGLAISRAGATTLSELACAGCPAVLVPYPGAIRDHQQRNAEYYADAGGAVIVPEGRVSEGGTAELRLADALEKLLDSSDRLESMSRAMRRVAKPFGAAAVADLLLPRAAITRAA